MDRGETLQKNEVKKPHTGINGPPAISAKSPDHLSAQKYNEYRTALGRQRIGAATRSAIVMGVIIQNLFLILDYLTFEEQFRDFLGTRMVINLGFAISYAATSRFPRIAMMGASYSLGLGMLALIYADGVIADAYYAGLILCFFGMGVLLPMSAGEAVLSAGTMAGIFITVPFLSAGEIPNAHGLNSFFVIAAAVEAVLCSFFLDRMRFKDYTQQQRLVEAEAHLRELDQAKTRFSANIHHELRTPLTLMLAPLEGLRSGDYGEVSEVAAKTFRTMHVNGQRLLKLINNLLDLAKLESNQFEIRRGAVDLAELVTDIVDGASPMAERKSILLRAESFEMHSSLYADKDSVEQILVNLLGNALKFTDEGGEITVGVRPDENGVEIFVRDTGVGLAEDQLNRVFDRFAQVDSSATRHHEGTGIGLSLTQELVELHSGRIWAESEGVGHGATMRFFLPFGEPDAQGDELVLTTSESGEVNVGDSISVARTEFEGVDRESHTSNPRFTGQTTPYAELERTADRSDGQKGPQPQEFSPDADDERPSVLITDDNADMRELICFILQRDFRIRTARNGREALEILEDYRPNLILSDIMMPELSGTELCAAVKGDERLREIPVVLVSSKADSEMKIAGLQLGADDYVTKPFHPRELLARAKSHANLHQARAMLHDQNKELQKTILDLELTEGRLIQSERLAAIGELAAGVAHEVNNPVNFALNASRSLKVSIQEIVDVAKYASNIDWGNAGDAARNGEALQAHIESIGVEELSNILVELSDIISSGLERTNKIVVELRDFAAPGKAGELVDVDLHDSAQATLSLLQHDLSNAEIQVSAATPGNPPIVTGDPGALNQILLNLIKNAAEALPASNGRIDVSVRTEKEWVFVEVSDNGAGVHPDLEKRLFEPFFTTKEAGSGTGLGLAMCHRIAKDHGGRIEFRSDSGNGCTFSLCLPAAN
ncbi:MAG: ATP-binding protein [Myxococcota bacterium]